MKYYIPSFRATVLTLVFLVSFSSSAWTEEPITLRVLSYNIHHCQGVDGKFDIERIAKVIESAKPDLVALQEVDQKTARSYGIDQPSELARLTKMKVVFGHNIDFESGRYGNAVLSKLPILQSKNHLLPNFADGEQRGVLEVELAIPLSTEKLLLFDTHFDHRKDDRERVASAQKVNQLVENRDKNLAILAGDLNDTIGSDALKVLDKQWKRANQEAEPTIPVAKPARQIDFILTRPADRWKVVEVKVLDEAVASDHRAILAVFQLTPAIE